MNSESFRTGTDLLTITTLFLSAVHFSFASEPSIWDFSQAAMFLH